MKRENYHVCTEEKGAEVRVFCAYELEKLVMGRS